MDALIPFGDDAADAFVGSVEHSGGDESIDHDHYLYGWSKEADDRRVGS